MRVIFYVTEIENTRMKVTNKRKKILELIYVVVLVAEENYRE